MRGWKRSCGDRMVWRKMIEQGKTHSGVLRQKKKKKKVEEGGGGAGRGGG